MVAGEKSGAVCSLICVNILRNCALDSTKTPAVESRRDMKAAAAFAERKTLSICARHVNE